LVALLLLFHVFPSVYLLLLSFLSSSSPSSQHKAFTHPDTFSPLSESSHREKGRLFSPLLDWPTLEKIYPRYPNIQDIRITVEVR
jgi:hypothetical protein